MLALACTCWLVLPVGAAWRAGPADDFSTCRLHEVEVAKRARPRHPPNLLFRAPVAASLGIVPEEKKQPAQPPKAVRTCLFDCGKQSATPHL